jgi:hypothetical protein
MVRSAFVVLLPAFTRSSSASWCRQLVGRLYRGQLVLQFADMLLLSAAVLWKQQLQKDPSNCSQAVATEMRLKSIWERAR